MDYFKIWSQLKYIVISIYILFCYFIMINQSQNQITQFTQYGIIIFFAIIVYYVFYKFDEFINIFFRKYEYLSQLTNSTNSIEIGDTIFFSDGSIGIGKNISIGSDGSFKIGPTLIDSTGKFLTSNTNDSTLFPPVTSGLIALYDYSSVSADGFTLSDLVGNNHATVTNTRLQIENSIDVTGIETTIVNFPTTILPPSYTLFTLAKYNTTDSSKRLRIFTNKYDSTNNWLSGFFNGSVAVAHHNTWITPSTIPSINNLYNNNKIDVNSWILSSDQYTLYRANKNNLTLNTFGSKLSKDQVNLTINSLPFKQSIFSFRCIIVYDRELSTSEIISVENWIATTYNL